MCTCVTDVFCSSLTTDRLYRAGYVTYVKFTARYTWYRTVPAVPGTTYEHEEEEANRRWEKESTLFFQPVSLVTSLLPAFLCRSRVTVIKTKMRSTNKRHPTPCVVGIFEIFDWVKSKKAYDVFLSLRYLIRTRNILTIFLLNIFLAIKIFSVRWIFKKFTCNTVSGVRPKTKKAS